jgi:hypothetical protein
MQNLGNVYIWGSPFVMSSTDAQNGVETIFNLYYHIPLKDEKDTGICGFHSSK